MYIVDRRQGGRDTRVVAVQTGIARVVAVKTKLLFLLFAVFFFIGVFRTEHPDFANWRALSIR